MVVDHCVNPILKVSCSQTYALWLTVFAEAFPFREELVGLRFRVGLGVLDEAVLQNAPETVRLIIFVF